LKEREEKKEQRLKQLMDDDTLDTDIPPFPKSLLENNEESAAAITDTDDVNDDDDDDVKPHAVNNNDDNNDDVVAAEVENVVTTIPQIHSRKYREYCCQLLDKRIDETCTTILQKLVQFQERMFQKDPTKAKARRRYVLGLREVTKHLKLKKLKLVIISPNLEKIQAKGGLDDTLNTILSLCDEQQITYVFALGRKAMGCAVGKLVPVSIVGVFDYNGVEDLYKQLVELVDEAQQNYNEMISIYQQEIKNTTSNVSGNNGATSTSATSSTTGSKKRFAHMTHSRNASAASAVSIFSFISEPISEYNEGNNWRSLMGVANEGALSPQPEDATMVPCNADQPQDYITRWLNESGRQVEDEEIKEEDENEEINSNQDQGEQHSAPEETA